MCGPNLPLAASRLNPCIANLLRDPSPPNLSGYGKLASPLRLKCFSGKPLAGVYLRVTKSVNVMVRVLTVVFYVGREKIHLIFFLTASWLSCFGVVSDHGCMSPGLRPPLRTYEPWLILWLGPRGDCFGLALLPCVGLYGRQGINLLSNMSFLLSLLIDYLRLVYSCSSGVY